MNQTGSTGPYLTGGIKMPSAATLPAILMLAGFLVLYGVTVCFFLARAKARGEVLRS